MKHITSINNLQKEDILALIKKALEIKQNPDDYSDSLKNKLVATLFFEPSTRTRLSFCSAALRAGAQVLGFDDANTTSTQKGETLEDTIRVINGFADIIAMRHPQSGAAVIASKVSAVPLINAGDGTNEHPTQALLDYMTIYERKKSLENVKIAFVGDLKYGRTVHSLAQGLVHFNPTLYFISPLQLQVPGTIKESLQSYRIAFHELEKWSDIPKDIDILYMTRVQKERFKDQNEYERLKDSYILSTQSAKAFSQDCLFMHPLPRVNEISSDIDQDPRATYFEEAHNGVWMRMAIFIYVLNS